MSNFSYFNGIVPLGTIFSMQGRGDDPLDEFVNVTISSLTDEVLQEMMITTLCTEVNDLTIGKLFGGMELSFYRNSATSVNGFEQAFWTYTAMNIGTIPISITEFTTVTNGADSGQPPQSELGIAESVVHKVEFLLSLIEPGITYTGVMDVAGNPGGCSAMSESTATINF
jgi:hypothetical protein